jgi:DNA-binding response OmpR family regulator
MKARTMTDAPSGNRLLVVDDDRGIGRLVKRVAEGVGFEVVVTEDPNVFAKTGRQWHPTVIILDLNIPGTDGVQLLHTLAEDKCAAHIVLSSGADGKVMEAALRVGGECGLKMGPVLQKPMRIETLRGLLREFQVRAESPTSS